MFPACAMVRCCSFDSGNAIPIGGDNSNTAATASATTLIDTSVTALTPRLTRQRVAQFAVAGSYNGTSMHPNSTIEVVVDGAALWLDVAALTQPPVLFDTASNILELSDLTGGVHTLQVC